MEEVWKKHKDYNYEISNFGNVRRLGKIYIDKDGVERRKETRNLKSRLVGGFTTQISFSKTVNKTSQIKSYSVNKLVAEYFLPKPKANEIILEHIDGDPTNNRADNLRWITRKTWTEKHRDMIDKRTKLSLEVRKANKEKAKKEKAEK